MPHRGFTKHWTAPELGRMLCAIDPDILKMALILRARQCPTTAEIIDDYLEVLLFLLGFLPAGVLARPIIRGLIAAVNFARRALAR